jgi:hypothetical protein
MTEFLAEAMQFQRITNEAICYGMAIIDGTLTL